MRDSAISLPRINKLHPALRAEIIATIDAIEARWPENMKVRIVQGLRTIDEQNALFAQGRTKDGQIVTNAKGGSSYHNYGLAFDFAIMYDLDRDGSFETLSWDVTKDLNENHVSDWQEVVQAFKAIGWAWGGDWRTIKDNPHLEKSFGYTVQELFAKYKNGDVNDGYVII